MAPKLVCYGIPLNLKAAMQYVLKIHPEYRDMMENYPFVDWRMPVIGLAIEDVRKMCGISDLIPQFVWLGGGHKAYLWSFPDKFVRRYSKLGETEKQLLHKFRAIINEPAMPKFYYSSEDPEPEFYKSVEHHEELLNAYAIDRMNTLFASDEKRKAAVKMLLEAKEEIWADKQKA